MYSYVLEARCSIAQWALAYNLEGITVNHPELLKPLAMLPAHGLLCRASAFFHRLA